jgi:hypothetical protein
VTADPSPLRRVLPFGHRVQNPRATRSLRVEPEVAVDGAVRFMCMPLCTIPMEAVRRGPYVVNKNHHAKTSRLLVAIGQPFREQSVTPKAGRGTSSGLSDDEVWPSSSEQSLPERPFGHPSAVVASTDTAASRRSARWMAIPNTCSYWSA